MLSIYAFLEVLIGRGRDALFRLGQEIYPLAEDDRPCGAYAGAGRLLVLLQALVEAELTLDDLRIPVVPLELWHVERASHLAVTATYATRTFPSHGAPFILLQGTKGTTSDASGVQAGHALFLDIRKAPPIGLLVALDDVLGLRIKARRHVPEAPGERCVGRQPICLVAGHHAGLATRANRVVVEHGNGVWRGLGMRRVFLGGCRRNQRACDCSSKPEDSQECLTASDPFAHAHFFSSDPCPPSDVSAVGGGSDPGMLSSPRLVENIRDAT